MADIEVSVLTKELCIGTVAEVMMGCRCQPIPSYLPLFSCRFQLIQKSHQFIHFGDDALLLS
jgi:hypothetical protein